MPNPRGELSVFRVQGLGETEIWDIGRNYVSRPQGKTLRGRGEVTASLVQQQGLVVEADDIPPRHANVLGWPLEKSARKLIAVELANQASLRICPD